MFEDRLPALQRIADALIERCELMLIEPDNHRPQDITDTEWFLVKRIASENINGRDFNPEAPLEQERPL
jgi:hypothetical protein